VATAAQVASACHAYFSRFTKGFPDQFIRAEQVELASLPWDSYLLSLDRGEPRQSRRADLIALERKTPIGSPYLHFVEIKVARSDWLAELKQPEKSQVFLDAGCDFGWLAAPAGVAEMSELPDGWGYLEYADGKVKAKRKPAGYRRPKLNSGADRQEWLAWREQARAKQPPVNRELLAGFARALVRSQEPSIPK